MTVVSFGAFDPELIETRWAYLIRPGHYTQNEKEDLKHWRIWEFETLGL